MEATRLVEFHASYHEYRWPCTGPFNFRPADRTDAPEDTYAPVSAKREKRLQCISWR